jgi:hypothetical protein
LTRHGRATSAAACYFVAMKSAKNGSKNGAHKAARPRATPRQQAARKKYLEQTGTKVSQDRIAAIRAQWEG